MYAVFWFVKVLREFIYNLFKSGNIMDNLINIAFVSHFPHLKMGGQRSMTHLIENLDRTRFRPFAICPEPGELSEKLESIGCKCFFVPFHSLKPKFLSYAIPNIFKVRDIIKSYNIDIIHPDFTADTFICGLAKKGTSCKMVWHVRWNEHFPKDRIHERLADGIIGVSDAAGTRFSDTPAIKNKYITIYNGVDCEKFCPIDDKKAKRRELGIDDSRFMLIFVGVLKEGKGVLDIANALAILKKDKDLPEMPLCVFAGSKGKQETYDELLKIFKDNDLEGDIDLVGQQTNIHEWMQAADALMIPSHEGHEGMPRVLYESISCGTVGIGSNTSGVNEAVTPDSGILVEEMTPTDIAAAVKKIMLDPDLVKDLQINGRKRALEFFDIKKHAKSVQDFYAKILNL